MFALGNSLFACGICSACERSFEAFGETDVGRRLLLLPPDYAHCRHYHCCCRHALLLRQPNPNLNKRPPRALFCPKLDNSSCYACYSCDNNCNVVFKLVQEYRCYFIHFTSVLRKQFTVNNRFLSEANSSAPVLAAASVAPVLISDQLHADFCV